MARLSKSALRCKDDFANENRENNVSHTCHFETWYVSQQTDVTRLITCDTENTAICARL